VGVVLDTSVIVEADRGRLDLGGYLRDRDDDAVAISAITASELLRGVLAADAAHAARRTRLVEGVLRELTVAPFDLDTARIHARLWADLAQRGRLIGAHDLQIAATALTLGYRLVTMNQREFERVPGLDLEDLRRWRT
jgi:tRNA(fMet)-specific endonuclease VapC